MPVSLVRRELKNARIYFIPAGTVVGAVTVARASWPTGSPASNYTDWEFTDVETLTSEKEVEEEIFRIPRSTGGYKNDKEETVLGRTWTATTAKTNNLLKQLEHNLPATVVAGTPQAPLTGGNSIEGVMLLEIQNKNSTIIERTQVWAKLRVVTPGDVGPATAKVQFSIEQLESSLNTYVVN